MRFLPFDKCRDHMLGQYEKAKETISAEAAGTLYCEVRKAYDAEKYPVLGKGRAIKTFLDSTELYVNPYDVFADLCANEIIYTPIQIRKEIYSRYHKKSGEAKRLTRLGMIFANGDYSHTMPDWNKLLKVGFTGIAEEAEALLSGEDISPERAAFYESVAVTYRAIASFSKRLADEVTARGGENSEFTASNLYAIASGAPSTLGEAMQLYFIYYMVQQNLEGAVLRSLGEIDTLLLPFYENDLRNGADEKELRELIRFFLFKWYTMKAVANIPFDTSSEGNKLTYIILEEYVALDVHDPKIRVKVTDKTPSKLLELIMESIRIGKNSFAFINEKTVIESLMKIGIKKEDAENYTLIGCYEPMAIGKELPCTVNGKLPLPAAIRFALEEISDGGIAEPTCFEEFLDLTLSHVSRTLDVIIEEINCIERKYPSFMHAPALSGTYRSCMERGVDIYSGGAVYNNSSVVPYGIATFVDSLMAIKRAVYGDKLITLRELDLILKKNWEGEERLRKKIRGFDEKYGVGNADADALTQRIISFLSDNVNGRENGRGGVYRLGLFSIDWIFKMGANIGATPDGRLREEPVSKNLSPSIGMDRNGLTGVIRSVLTQDHSLIPDGAVLDVALHPTTVSGSEGIGIMMSILKLYIAGGGFAIQMNVVSPETLREAQREPEKYKNLQVRLCGWNVYFTDLEKEAQDNLINSMTNV